MFTAITLGLVVGRLRASPRHQLLAMRLSRFVLLGVIVAAAIWPGARALHAAEFEYHMFHMARTVPQMPADSTQLGLMDVEFRSADSSRLRGWYIASRTGASMIALGGSNSDRTAMLAYARLLAAGGTGVLLFDWPGCGTSDGHIGVGSAERDAVRGAVNFVAAQPDVRDDRIGVLGFSLGAHTALFAAADDDRVRALILEGAFANPWQQTVAEYAPSGRAAQWGALAGNFIAGMERGTPDLKMALRRLAPRSILVVAGTVDRTVPPSLSREVFDAASQPKAFWAIRGAPHGAYLTTDRTYGPRLRRYVESALAAPATAPAAR